MNKKKRVRFHSPNDKPKLANVSFTLIILFYSEFPIVSLYHLYAIY